MFECVYFYLDILINIDHTIKSVYQFIINLWKRKYYDSRYSDIRDVFIIFFSSKNLYNNIMYRL